MDKNKLQSNIVLCMISAVVGAGLTLAGTSIGNGNNKLPESFQKLSECVSIINEKGAGIFDENEAINGYLMGGADKYTHIVNDLSSDKVAEITEYVNKSGTAFASGFQVAPSEDGNILLTSVDEGKAAYNSGLRANDVVISIEGKEVSKEGFENIANKLLGKQDTEVKLVIRRGPDVQTITFKRDNTFVRDIEWEKKDNIGYIAIKGYSELSDAYMNKAIEELGKCEGYIVDVRQNGGGETDVCLNLLSHFAPGMKIEMIGDKIENEEKIVQKADPIIDAPVIILADSGTASSSEIITSAIKQYNSKAKIVGTNTKGKGVYQYLEKLKSGDYLSYTVGYFTVGDWECWQGVGIAPDVEVEMDPALIGTDKDIQLKKALELLD